MSDELRLLDDDDLDELQELLWRGYAPKPRQRYDLEVYPRWQWQKHISPQELKKAEAELQAERLELARKREEHWQEQVERRAEEEAKRRIRVVRRIMVPIGYQEFRCERCKQVFLSPIDDAEVEAEYQATFGNEPGPQLTLCEPCFDVMYAAWHAALS
jgi:hypothetical protein